MHLNQKWVVRFGPLIVYLLSWCNSAQSGLSNSYNASTFFVIQLVTQLAEFEAPIL